jgi:hypothetical protein
MCRKTWIELVHQAKVVWQCLLLKRMRAPRSLVGCATSGVVLWRHGTFYAYAMFDCFEARSGFRTCKTISAI